jgi:hypothetical protein
MAESRLSAEDRLIAGEATEADLLVIISFLGEDLLEAREAASVFAHFYDAICDQLKGTEYGYLSARGSLHERYLRARKTVAAFKGEDPVGAPASAPHRERPS